MVKGVVQGVGFRPFIYKLAVKNNLNGSVKNTSKGVYIDVEGKLSSINIFINIIKQKPPTLSKITEMILEDRPIVNYEDFKIIESDREDDTLTLISPDIGICDECLRDINDISNRRYRYPFTNCTNCGPRFSIIKKLPYDRTITTMDEFKMCEECYGEYINPLDRRFHAQPNACPNCGPKIELVDNHGTQVSCIDPIKQVVKYIKEGSIVGIKGLGGFHLACDGNNEKVIQSLRNKKHRPTKPLALMMRDISIVKKYCSLSRREEVVISNNKRPILLLNKKENKLPNNIAPNNKKIGVMLPYTPLHHLIFDQDVEVLVMTSGNISSLPIIYKNDEALDKLKNIADYLLIHNRDIYVPVDDSISKVMLDEERVIRNSRGYAPMSIGFECIRDILAYGSHLKNTFALSRNNNIFISQYIGDMENLETHNRFEKNVSHMKKIHNINHSIIAYDMHPNYWALEYVKSQKIEKIPIQHHHAHIVSCMVENKIKDIIIGLAYDGIGYGSDGEIWGAEFLVCDYRDFIRAGHVNYVEMPGGDAATKEPWRMAVSYMYKVYGIDIYKNIPHCLKEKDIKRVVSIIKSKINSPKSSSMGRLFDAVSALAGFTGKVTFEGEAAILLESIADINACGKYDYDIDYIKMKHIINTDKIIKGIIEDIDKQINYSIISKKFHNTIIDFSVRMCNIIAKKYNIRKVALSGGVFQNEILLVGIYEKLISQGFEVYTHRLIPCNDSGISLGQLVIANANFKE
ncbi:carbamoyltransferase HypF [Wukongibacter sp. M2B1]|uniref:carbamoyltransferase HypF n=1 Tax=Wukongibacter sp. M2B1 TaxID=3088895 RepID=UPI003D7A7F5B